MLHLLRADAGLVSRDPEERELGSDGGRIVGVLCDCFFVHVVHVEEAVGDHLAERRVVGVDVRCEELGEHVGLLHGCRGGYFAAGLLFDVLGAVARSCFGGGEEAFLLCFEGAGKAIEEWVEGGVEGEMV